MVYDTAQASSPAATGLPASRRREEDDAYPGVVTQISQKVRVINCKHDLQWIIQGKHGLRWRSISFCRERASLLRLLDKFLTDEMRAVILALPERHV